MRSNLFDVVVALDLARVVFKKIKLNFMWAISYNLIAIPFAAGVWFPWTHVLVPPQYAGLAMAFSSVSVVLSSLSLKLYKRPTSPSDECSAAAGDGISGRDLIGDGGVKKNIGTGGIWEAARRRLARIFVINSSKASNSFGAKYSKLAMDDVEEEVLGLELGLGGFGGLRR